MQFKKWRNEESKYLVSIFLLSLSYNLTAMSICLLYSFFVQTIVKNDSKIGRLLFHPLALLWSKNVNQSLTNSNILIFKDENAAVRKHFTKKNIDTLTWTKWKLWFNGFKAHQISARVTFFFCEHMIYRGLTVVGWKWFAGTVNYNGWFLSFLYILKMTI